MSMFSRIARIASAFLLSLTLFVTPTHAQGSPVGAKQLEAEMKEFFDAGAKGYLVWLYSGDQGGGTFASDPYSIWRNQADWSEYCAVFKTMSSRGFVGVNIWDAGKYPVGMINSHFKTLSDCGATVVRVFASEGGVAGAQNVLAATQGTNIKVIFAIANPVLGQYMPQPAAPAEWYASGYQTEYLPFARSLAQAVAGNAGLYGLELANEPHCGGDPAKLAPYTSWAANVSQELRNAGISQVGIGQMAQSPGEICDNPDKAFAQTNKAGSITMTSGHYYDNVGKQLNLKAVAVSKSIGKPFYVGEAGFAGKLEDEAQASVFIYKGIDDQEDYGKKIEMAAKYKLTCASAYSFAGKLENEGLTGEPDSPTYVNEIPGDTCVGNSDPRCIIPKVVGTASYDMGTATIPLYRLQTSSAPNPQSATRRREDLEGYFSSVYTGANKTTTSGVTGPSTTQNTTKKTTDEDLIRPLANGTQQKLLTSQQLCEDKLTFLTAIKESCEEGTWDPAVPKGLVNNQYNTQYTKPENVGTCALDQKIPEVGNPDGSYTYLSVLASKPGGFSCSDPVNSAKGNAKWLQAFSNIEITTPKGFAPAYIVRYIDLPQLPGFGEIPGAETIPDASIRLFQHWYSVGEPPDGAGTNGTLPYTVPQYKLKNRVRVTKVYVPTGLSKDERQISPSGEKSYTGAFMRTMQSIFSLDEQQEITKKQDEEVKKVEELTNQQEMNTPSQGSRKYLQCPECSEPGVDNLESILARRINAEGFAVEDGENLQCDGIGLRGEQATAIMRDINPLGNPDPVIPTGVRMAAKLRAFGDPNSFNVRVRTYLLLPEEYRNISDYELAFGNRFLTQEEQENQPIFAKDMITAVSGGYKYLMMSATAFNLIAPKTPGEQRIGYTLRQEINPETGTIRYVPDEDKFLAGRIEGSSKNGNPNPQVPGGILARTLWHIVCGVTRPSDGKTPAEYKGLEQLLLTGTSACSDTTTTAATSSATPRGELCSGTTTVPAGKDWNAFFSIFEQAAAGTQIPAKYLYGVFRIEGTPTYNAFFFDRGSLVCKPNALGAVGPMQLMVGACGAPYATFESNAPAGANPCDLEDSLKAAARYFETYKSRFTDTSGNTDWEKLLCTYGGINNACPTNIGGCNDLNYGQCAMSFAEGFGTPGN